MSDIESLKKQNRDLADLYEQEKERADNATTTLGDFWRREPLVHLLWQEIILLRKLLENHFKTSAAVIDLPQQRAKDRSKANGLSYRDQLITATFKVLHSEKISVDTLIDASRNGGNTAAPTPVSYQQPPPQQQQQQQPQPQQVVSVPVPPPPEEESLSPAQMLEKQLQQRHQPMGAGNDALSSQISQQQQRIAELESLVAQLRSAAPSGGDPAASGVPAAAAAPAAPAEKVMMSVIAPDAPPAPAKIGSYQAQPARAPLQAMMTPGGAAPAAAGGAAPAGDASAPAAAGGPGSIPAPDAPPAPPKIGSYLPSGVSGPAPSGAPAAAAAPVAVAPPPDPGPQPTKPMVKPQKKMKALHWKPIIACDKNKQTEVTKKSIWAQIDSQYPTFLRSINIADLEERFSNAPVKKKAEVAQKEEKPAVDENKPQRLLDPKLHQQLSIMLSKMPSLPVMRKAILELDSNVLKRDHVDALHKNLFTSEDVELIKSSGVPKERLQQPEQWILEMSKIPQLSARLECWRFSLMFEEQFLEVHRPLARVETAAENIRKSQILPYLYGLILAIGNHLNGSTPRGRADGFGLDTLGKISRIRDNISETGASLLDYVADIAVKSKGEGIIQQLKDDFGILSEVKILSMKGILNDARKLQGKMNLTTKMKSLVLAQAQPGDPFERIIGKFLEDSDRKVKNLEDRAKSVYAALIDLFLYLEPDLDRAKAEQITSEEYFSALDEFFKGIVNSYENAKKRQEDHERQSKQAAHIAELRKAMAGGKKPPGGGDGGGDPTQSNELAAGGFPKLRSAGGNPQAAPKGRGGEEPQGFAFPKLKSTGGPNAGGQTAPAEKEPQGFAFPKLKSVQTNDKSSSVQPQNTQLSGNTGGVNPFKQMGRDQRAAGGAAPKLPPRGGAAPVPPPPAPEEESDSDLPPPPPDEF